MSLLGRLLMTLRSLLSIGSAERAQTVACQSRIAKLNEFMQYIEKSYLPQRYLAGMLLTNGAETFWTDRCFTIWRPSQPRRCQLYMNL